MGNSLRGPLGDKVVHLCVDMQRIFSSEGLWAAPWMERVLPVVVRIAERFSERTIFTRFIPPNRPEDMPGMWQHYYRKWHAATRAQIDPQQLDLMPPLARLVPPAAVVDKTRYSAFAEPHLLAQLNERGINTLVVTGSDTDVCVLATVLGAVDHGYRVILVRDGVCSSSDEGHDALLTVYHRRYSEQIETANSEDLFDFWR